MDNVESTLLTRYRNARRNAARKIQNALFDTLASAITEQGTEGPINKTPDNFSDIIYKNKELLIEALDDKTENSFKDRIVSELRKIEKKDDVDALKDNTLLSKLLIEMAEQLKDSEQELSAINTVVDRFDFFTGENKKLQINTHQIKVTVDNNEHSISKLSSGERHILTLLTLLLDQGRHRNFIIIDEPEISLNARWQEALLPTLEELLPSCQIIVASHSPILAATVDNLAELQVMILPSSDAGNINA
jgi:predicted ATPase